MEKNDSSIGRRSTLGESAGTILSENGAFNGTVDSIARQNIASTVEHHGSGRRSLSESLLVDSYAGSGNVSLRKQFHDEEETSDRVPKISEHHNFSQVIVVILQVLS